MMLKSAFLIVTGLLVSFLPGCAGASATPPEVKTVPHANRWGIYELDLATRDVRLIYGADREIYASALRLNSRGDRFLFAQKIDGQTDNDTEICSVDISGQGFRRLTNNKWWDLYPAWSPDDARIAFLSWREKDLDIYVMDADGSNTRKLYDSGDHDADIDWAGDNIVFTSQFAIWKIDADGQRATQVTRPPDRGLWGQANLPAGDYDPRLSPDGQKIAFERLEDTGKLHGGYDIFTINSDGTGETRLTDSGYAQGLASWSHSGRALVYIVAAINDEGKYDIYMMNSDGTGNRNITPGYFPADFLCHNPIFSQDDTRVYFIGEWWE
jgi:Tol biopolymer transport system component